MFGKLSREDGMSMLVALLFFLVATMVSMVVVTAGVTTVRRVHDDRAREQATLNVGSAARVVRGMLAGSSVEVTWTGTPVEGEEGAYSWSAPSFSGSGDMGETLAGIVSDAVSAGGLASESSPVTRDLIVSVSWEAEGLEDCTLHLEAWPTSDVGVTPFDEDVTVRGTISDARGGAVMAMPEVRLLGMIAETGAARRCEMAWADDTQVRFVGGGDVR